ncbi:uncharacterized protein si:dkey-39a18.1 isoform X2 [Alosa sapidissima]|nr:uncharacterized protein si:dkey-39a18.1 isoform X2 [Alosa sapidissima]XP_041936395.1 uncharacterized protein si:dkey-39a18.1 isoform X2 [Alosa sapidissima]XP_041936397.1 uncharacterized protein si:dkey-39a18.1 isoform X2 [Alosa sapidissima]XP_041936398.1 uncharacterized protein si:dkey-39a18.1 isoform X2 [Alosa sapidissima]XP_041936399.1 uncharacterized protein si:dkey-39a18.1 isoform X2 [Alosa sapidissima]
MLCGRMRRLQSPCREVSPVPSCYSEPVSLPPHKDVLRGLASVGEVDREDAEEVLSLRSLPCVRKTLNKDLQKVKRSRGFPTRQLVKDVSDVRLPAISHQQPESRSMLIVRGLRCGRKVDKCPPLMSSSRVQDSSRKASLPERPPGRAGRRPDRQIVSSSSSELSPPHHHPSPRGADPTPQMSNEMADSLELSSRHPSHNPLGSSVSPHRQFLVTTSHASHGVTNTGKTATHAVLPRPGWRRGVAFKRGALECVWEEEGCGPPPPLSGPYPHLLEPLSGFREQLHRQLLHSPLPYRDEATSGGAHGRVTPTSAHHHHHHHHHIICPLDGAAAVPQGSVTILLQDAVDVPGWHGRTLPKITMTRPTPSPKHATLRCAVKADS